MEYQILDWDTEFLGVTVARVAEPDLNEFELVDILTELKAKGAALVYWSSNRELEKDFVTRLGGNLTDYKTTFALDFRDVDFEKFANFDIVEAYTQSMPYNDIVELAIQSGEYSRFSVDPNIPKERFLTLYKIWIDRSLAKEIAEEVLVIREDKGQRVVGMVTLGNKQGRGDIGLIAVDREHRGKRYGEQLVHAAQRWFVNDGYKSGQVVTQGANAPACSLYRKCGYSVERVEYFYHFWLTQGAVIVDLPPVAVPTVTGKARG